MEIIKNYGSEIELLNKNAYIFANYVKENFDMDDLEIKGKYLHTFRVAKMCLEVGEKLGLDKKLAYNIGLLHDYARFVQWTKYHSFNDHLTTDHANESQKMLFENEEIKKFDIPKEDYNIISLAIKFHNKAQIDINYLKEIIKNSKENKFDLNQILLYCKLIRDCDKMDLFNRIGRGELELFSDKNGLTPCVLERIKNHTFVLTKEMNTKLDRVLSFIGFLFDINFPETLTQINFDNYFLALDEFYGKKMIKEDRKILLQTIEEVKPYFTKKLKDSLNSISQ